MCGSIVIDKQQLYMCQLMIFYIIIIGHCFTTYPGRDEVLLHTRVGSQFYSIPGSERSFTTRQHWATADFRSCSVCLFLHRLIGALCWWECTRIYFMFGSKFGQWRSFSEIKAVPCTNSFWLSILARSTLISYCFSILCLDTHQ